MDELVIKVPAPFSGVADVGFSARYPAQGFHERLRDVPFIVEGPPLPMRRLVQRLSLFAEKPALVGDGDGEAYSWTTPVQLTDEVCVLAFRDHSTTFDADDAAAVAARQYTWNLVRPLAFTFLRDCVRLGGLRLAESIALVVDLGHPPLVDLELERRAISAENGTVLLAA